MFEGFVFFPQLWSICQPVVVCSPPNCMNIVH
jgi:hypothetical protein